MNEQAQIRQQDFEFLSFDCADFDQFRQNVSGFDTDPVQLSSGALDLSFAEVAARGAHYGLLRLKPKIADRAAISPRGLTLYLPLAPQSLCGFELGPGTLMLMRPGREYRSVLCENYSSLEVSLSEERAIALGLENHLEIPRHGPEDDMVSLGAATLHGFQTIALDLFPALKAERSNIGRETLAQILADRFDQLLTRRLGSHQGRPNTPPNRAARYDLAAAALREIDRSKPIAGLTSASLSKILGVSTRAVEKAFHSVLGISPGRYLLARRLEHARRELLHPNGRPMNVGRAALEAGFGHLGRFSAHYQRHFGELPSDSLRSARERLTYFA